MVSVNLAFFQLYSQTEIIEGCSMVYLKLKRAIDLLVFVLAQQWVYHHFFY